MSFSIQISSDLISVEAGDNSPLNLQVVNRGEEVDRFEVGVEGLDPEWTAIPVPIFTVGIGETQTEKIFFKPGRASESLAGNYPFVVKVRSLNSGESRQAQGVVQIKPYNHLSMEVLPKKGSVSPVRGAETFHASIINLGNTEQTLQLYGSDPEDCFAFEFGQEQVTVGPGQQKEVEIRATPTNARPFASPRIYVFTISARSIQTPSLVASSQAQIEQRPIITPATVSVLFLLFLLGFGWYLSRPQPPVVKSLQLAPSSASYSENDVVTVTWQADHATSVLLTINDDKFNEPPEGSTTFNATKSGSVEAIAIEDRTQSRPMAISFEVKQPKVEPPPTVDQFDITPREINVGQSFEIHYKVSHAIKAVLEPTDDVLDPNLDTYEMPAATKPGKTTYTLVAETGTNSDRSRSITVKVVQASAAKIVFFDVQPRSVEPMNNNVTIQWQVTDAARITLSVGGAITDLTAQPSGQQTIPITQNTEIFLVAFDSSGITTKSQHLTVKMKPPPTEPAPATGTTGDNNSNPTTGNNIPPTQNTGGGG